MASKIRKARPYYTLAIKEDGAWSPQFGDYDKQAVIQERIDSYAGFAYRIVTTDDAKQATINAQIGLMNGLSVGELAYAYKVGENHGKTHGGADPGDMPMALRNEYYRGFYHGEKIKRAKLARRAAKGTTRIDGKTGETPIVQIRRELAEKQAIEGQPANTARVVDLSDPKTAVNAALIASGQRLYNAIQKYRETGAMYLSEFMAAQEEWEVTIRLVKGE